MINWTGVLAGGVVAGVCAVAAVAADVPAKGPAPKPAPRAGAGPLTPAEEFFETRVRPVLAEKCYPCHGPKVAQAGLRLDSAAALLKGTDRGTSGVVPGNPDKSLILQAVRYTGTIKMPPQGKLPDAEIQALTDWVKQGAVWPTAGQPPLTPPTLGGPGGAAPGPKSHWSFQPVRLPALPAVKDRAWVKTPIDAFVLAKLEARGLQPALPADPRTLIRRVTFDLTGLPPTPEEVDQFVRDCESERPKLSPRADKPGHIRTSVTSPTPDTPHPTPYTRLVDRLLASPRYGERWGRYWLDVARYADTKGYVFQEERRYPFAYTYRDYVIRAFNEDLPYDRFLIEQLAADCLPLGEDKRPLAAMGFLTLGRRFLNSQPDIIDDRLDVVFRGTQALTVGCARCHDHKFDPIPTADYYSLYGVFASSYEPAEPPLIGAAEQSAAYQAYETELKKRQAVVDAFQAKKLADLLAKGRAKIGESLLAARQASQPGAEVRRIAEARGLPAAFVTRWVNFLAETRKRHHPLFSAWNELAALPDADFAAKAPALVAGYARNADPARLLNPNLAAAFAKGPATTLDEVAQLYQRLLEPTTGPDQELVHALDSIGCPLNLGPGEIGPFLARDERNQLQGLQQKVAEWRSSSPVAPPAAMVLLDSKQPVTPRIFRRGNQNNPGEEVPRQFLAVLSGASRKPFQHGSGRLELAQAIASRDNPLTARVMVNRVWNWHFGSALVRTPSDFGLRSDAPTNPELLDYLAYVFSQPVSSSGNDGEMERGRDRGTETPDGLGWSLKRLHRLILLSSTYQQASDPSPGPSPTGRGERASHAAAHPNTQHPTPNTGSAIDPENALYWRMNRRRLDWEAMRDTLLAASGKLDLTLGGRPVDLLAQPFVPRRTVYGFIDRQNLPGLYRMFDYASPDTHSPQRFTTTVPQQALFLMNSPFAVEQARALAALPELGDRNDAAGWVRSLYRRVYQRLPTPEELKLGVEFLQRASASASAVTPASAGAAPAPGSWLSPYEKYAQVLLMSNELAFVD